MTLNELTEKLDELCATYGDFGVNITSIEIDFPDGEIYFKEG